MGFRISREQSLCQPGCADRRRGAQQFNPCTRRYTRQERIHGGIEQMAVAEHAPGPGQQKFLLGHLQAANDAGGQTGKMQRGTEENFAGRGIFLLSGFDDQRKDARENLLRIFSDAFDECLPVRTSERGRDAVGKQRDRRQAVSDSCNGLHGSAADFKRAAFVPDPGAPASGARHTAGRVASQRCRTGSGNQDHAWAGTNGSFQSHFQICGDVDVGSRKALYQMGHDALDHAGTSRSSQPDTDGRHPAEVELSRSQRLLRGNIESLQSGRKAAAQRVRRTCEAAPEQPSRGIEQNRFGLGAAAIHTEVVAHTGAVQKPGTPPAVYRESDQRAAGSKNGKERHGMDGKSRTHR